MSPKRKQPTEVKEVLPKEMLEPPHMQRKETPVGERLYETIGDGDLKVIVGPHEGFVDTLGLPEETATRLHNILYRRKVYNYTQAARRPQELLGAIQELYMLDAQKLLEALRHFEQESIEGG
jgi:hypothetical protein